MDLDLRRAILANIATNSQDDFKATIIDAIETGEENVLPGLGYLFELIWKQSDDHHKLTMLQSLEEGVKVEVSDVQ